MLAPRDLVEHDRAGDRFARGVALALAERLPVDAGLPRVDVLVDQPAREVLEAAIDLALDERGRHLERHPRGELLHQLARARRARPRAAPRARDPRGRAPAAPSSVLELAEILGELVVELGEDPALDALHRDGVVDRRVRELGDRVVGRIVNGERLGRADLEAEQLLVESGRVRLGAELDR